MTKDETVVLAGPGLEKPRQWVAVIMQSLWLAGVATMAVMPYALRRAVAA